MGWGCGPRQGYVASVTPHDCLRYTQFRAHNSDVRQIVTTPDGVLSLGAESIAFNSRTGLVLGRLERYASFRSAPWVGARDIL